MHLSEFWLLFFPVQNVFLQTFSLKQLVAMVAVYIDWSIVKFLKDSRMDVYLNLMILFSL